MLEGFGWQVAQIGVQMHVVVAADDAAGNVARGASVVGRFSLPHPLHLQVQKEAPSRCCPSSCPCGACVPTTPCRCVRAGNGPSPLKRPMLFQLIDIASQLLVLDFRVGGYRPVSWPGKPRQFPGQARGSSARLAGWHPHQRRFASLSSLWLARWFPPARVHEMIGSGRSEWSGRGRPCYMPGLRMTFVHPASRLSKLL